MSVVAFDAVVAVASLQEGLVVQMTTLPGNRAMDEVKRKGMGHGKGRAGEGAGEEP